MTSREQKQCLKIIAQIEKRLDGIEEVMSFMIKASTRFKKGQRVRFSEAAERKGITARTKGGVRTGTVTDAGDGFTVEVLLDGYKHPHGYHHRFFDRVR